MVFGFVFRVLLDRAHSDYNSAFRQLDVDMLSSPEHTSMNLFANTSETNTSDKCFSKDLSQILVNIKSCRWRHFRPRTTSLHDSDIVDFSCRTFHKGITRTGTAQPGTQTCSTSTSSKSSSGSAHFGMWSVALIILLFTWKCLLRDECPGLFYKDLCNNFRSFAESGFYLVPAVLHILRRIVLYLGASKTNDSLLLQSDPFIIRLNCIELLDQFFHPMVFYFWLFGIRSIGTT